jgi:hypothetical protein
VAEQAEFLRRAGEGLQSTADKLCSLRRWLLLRGLLRSSQKRSSDWRLGWRLWSRTILLLRITPPSCRRRSRLLPRRRKVFSSFFCVPRVVFFCSHVFLAFTELKSLLLRKDNEVTDLTNIVYRHADAVEKLTKIKDDADKQMVSDMKQIR